MTQQTDANAGLVGPIIVTRAADANPDGSPKDMDTELVTLFQVRVRALRRQFWAPTRIGFIGPTLRMSGARQRVESIPNADGQSTASVVAMAVRTQKMLWCIHKWMSPCTYVHAWPVPGWMPHRYSVLQTVAATASCSVHVGV